MGGWNPDAKIKNSMGRRIHRALEHFKEASLGAADWHFSVTLPRRNTKHASFAKYSSKLSVLFFSF